MEIHYILSTVFIISAAFYLFIQGSLRFGIYRCQYSQSYTHPFVSIIIAARNEEKTVERMLECLVHQTYSHIEIIIINDRSTDRTAQIITEMQKKDSRIQCITISNIDTDLPAKKNALHRGILVSRGDILCFTDADCFPPPSWIELMVQQFEPEVGLVAGYSPYQLPMSLMTQNTIFKNLFYHFISYEEIRAAIWSSGSIGWNIGWLCTGRNLAYRRTVYDEINGFEKIKHSVSGDDDLFLQMVRKHTDWTIRYVLNEGSFVPTVPPDDFHSFIEQRKRHFSAAKYFSLPMKMFFFFYHVSNMLCLVSPFLYMLHLLSLPVTLFSVAAKLFADIFLIYFSLRIFHGTKYRHMMMLMEFLYILYNSLIGPLGIFKKFSWKQA